MFLLKQVNLQNHKYIPKLLYIGLILDASWT